MNAALLEKFWTNDVNSSAKILGIPLPIMSPEKYELDTNQPQPQPPGNPNVISWLTHPSATSNGNSYPKGRSICHRDAHPVECASLSELKSKRVQAFSGMNTLLE